MRSQKGKLCEYVSCVINVFACLVGKKTKDIADPRADIGNRRELRTCVAEREAESAMVSVREAKLAAKTAPDKINLLVSHHDQHFMLVQITDLLLLPVWNFSITMFSS